MSAKTNAAFETLNSLNIGKRKKLCYDFQFFLDPFQYIFQKFFYLTIKWNFSQFNTRFVSTYLFNSTTRFSKHDLDDEPKIEKSSMKTSMLFSTKSGKMANIHLQKVVGALHKPKYIFLLANTPNEQVRTIFS